jgi:putative peptide zinc metalloprotease protein
MVALVLQREPLLTERAMEATDLLAARPRKMDDCTIEQQQNAADAPAYILKDAAGLRYMLLSPEGLFLWQLIDGERTIRELCQSYVAHYRRPAPREAMQAIARFCEAGLIHFENEQPARREDECWTGWLDQALRSCRWYCFLPNIDRPVTVLHRWVRVLYAPPVQAVLLFIAIAGSIAFLRHLAAAPWPKADLIVGAVSLILQVVIHEAAHAVTCKHFGRQVRRAGIGWYYFAPVAFVDTSDIWPAPRLQRVLVSAAGPYSNLVLSGLAALCALVLAPGAFADALLSFSAVGYVLALVNANPLLELDGYYIVMDILELPNLRARALACLGGVLHGKRGEPDARVRRTLIAFGSACLGYGLAMAWALFLACRASIQTLGGPSMASPVLPAISLIIAGTVSMLVLKRLLDDLRGVSKPSGPGTLAQGRGDLQQAAAQLR